MKSIFKDYLFNHNILVNDSKKSENALEIQYALAKLLGIRIVSGHDLLTKKMISYSADRLGKDVPAPFYRGFPQSVRELSEDQLLFDQLIHYAKTYGMGDFSEAGHSEFEKFVEREAFHEDTDIKDFRVLSETEAVEKLAEYTENLLKSTRPLSDTQFQFVSEYIKEYSYSIHNCASKNTALKLLLEFRNVKYARFITMSDVIKLVDELNYLDYHNRKIKKLNLKNQDRKFITAVINELFHLDSCNIKECCEKKAIWNGLLHHIHYRPFDDISRQFVDIMRGKENLSVYSEFEKAMASKDISEAVSILKQGKGSGAVLRHLNYIISHCETAEDLNHVFNQMETKNGIILLQLLMMYASYDTGRRTFQFVRHNMMTIHVESEEESAKRKSVLSSDRVELLMNLIKNNLEKVYADRLNKVYIDPDMKKIALPIQEGTSSSGYGILPKGSHLSIPEGKKIRAFTYWEKVNDIDLSVLGLCEDGSQKEFSWRSMWRKQSDVIIYSGDETSGFNGGSEYFDIDIPKFKRKYPEITHLIFCDNVYSSKPFSDCVCRAGYMLRDTEDSGEIFEPKTVKTSFTINCDSRFAYLFAIDLLNREFIWLNIGRDSNVNVAGTTAMNYLKSYFDVISVMNLYDFFSLMAKEKVDDISKADVVVTDKEVNVPDGVEVIHSTDVERIMALMN